MSSALVLNASPRGRQSNSQVLAEAFCQGMIAAGVTAKTLFLTEYNVEPCRGCFSCWGPTPKQCVIHDDMVYLRREVAQVDYLVLAFPLYVDSMPGPLKTFFDRSIADGEPWFEQDPHGETRHVEALKAPKLVVLSNCGFPEQSHFEALRFLFRRIARNFHTEVVAEVYKSQGGILRSSHPELESVKKKYLAAVVAAGQALVTNGAVPEELQRTLEEPFLPKDDYIAAVTRNFEALQRNS